MSLTSVVDNGGNGNLGGHFKTVVRMMLMGRVVPVLGAGASLYGRPRPMAVQPEPSADGAQADPAASSASTWNGAPSARELGEILKREFEVEKASDDLLEIAQWAYALGGGSGGLYLALREIFDRDFPNTGLHDFLADVPRQLRDAGKGRPPLIVTTNYDDLMEKSLTARGETYDLVVYMAEGPHEGLFCHVKPDGKLVPICAPERYLKVDPDKQTVVLKMHGCVSRRHPDDDSYVITEDHYIEYLTRTDLTKLLPKPVMARLLNCNLLFLGYSLRDWNFRAILHQIYRNRLRDNDWWAVQLNPDQLERKSWEKRNVELVDVELERYIPALARAFTSRFAPPADQP